MIRIEDKIRIRTPLLEVINWLLRMPQHYKAWHPKDHISFKALEDEQELKAGSVAKATEHIGKFTLSFKFKIINIGSDRMGWRAVFPYTLVDLHGEFLAEEQGGATELTAITYYGWQIPLLGKMLDWVIDSFFISREAAAKHMREEGEYLKNVIESRDKI